MPANPDLFRRMAEPFPDADAADAAIKAFYYGIETLRVQHKITNVYLIAEVTYLENGEEVAAALTGMFGDQTKAEGMTAYAFGKEQADHQAYIGKLLKGSVKRLPKQP